MQQSFLMLMCDTNLPAKCIFTDRQRSGEGNVFSCVGLPVSHSVHTMGPTIQDPDPLCTGSAPSSSVQGPALTPGHVQTCSLYQTNFFYDFCERILKFKNSITKKYSFNNLA